MSIYMMYIITSSILDISSTSIMMYTDVDYIDPYRFPICGNCASKRFGLKPKAILELWRATVRRGFQSEKERSSRTS